MVLRRLDGGLLGAKYKKYIADRFSDQSKWIPPELAAANQQAGDNRLANTGGVGKLGVPNQSAINYSPPSAPPAAKGFLDKAGDLGWRVAEMLKFLCYLVALASPAVIFWFARRDVNKLTEQLRAAEREKARLEGRLGETQKRAADTEREFGTVSSKSRFSRRGEGDETAKQEPDEPVEKKSRFRSTEVKSPGYQTDRDYQAPQNQSSQKAEPAQQEFIRDPIMGFIRWCHEASLHIHSIDRFRAFLEQSLNSLNVFPVYRDRNDGAQTQLVHREKINLGDAVEYWVVSWQGKLLLFPKPESDRFRELQPNFAAERDVPPKSLQEIEPGLLETNDQQMWVSKLGSLR
jgi:hypothetical protein